MELETTRFGKIEVDPESVLLFTQPVIGFAQYREYVLIPADESGGLVWLQCTERGDLAFLLMDPSGVIPDYDPELRRDELQELEASSPEDVDVYTILVVASDPAQIRTNLKAPVLVNPSRRLARQTILEREDYPLRFYLVQAQNAGDEHKEVENARSDA